MTGSPPPRTALVVTSIHTPNAAMRGLADGCMAHGWDFVVAGDSKSPSDFALEGCRFLSLAEQRHSGFALAAVCPEKSYTRKNLGYLEAIRAGAEIIVETDDDNHPKEDFWLPRQSEVHCRVVEVDGWVNTYGYFSDAFIYPRGLPLRHARDTPHVPLDASLAECPVQQGLADDDPDVDAVYRMLFPLPFRFLTDVTPVLLRGGSWCPFNSQNTTFFEGSFPLLYLPAGCSFRMTDIWRSFVAQRVLQARGLGVMFHGPTVSQKRNEHDLQRDFTEELSGYLHNAAIREALLGISLSRNVTTRVMMERCYGVLIGNGWVDAGEETLLCAWLDDLDACSA